MSKSKHARSTTHMVPPKDLVIVGLDTDDGPDHPLYDERINLPLDPAKLASTKEHGITEIVEAYTCPKTKRLLVVSGRQRTRYAREAELEAIEVKIRSSLDAKGLWIHKIRENALRTDLTPIQKAKEAKAAKEHDMSVAEIAVAFGVTDQAVRDWLKLLELAPEVVQAVEARQISAYNAVKTFAKVEPEQQPSLLAELVAAGPGAEVRPDESGKPTVKPKGPQQPKQASHKALAAWMAGDTSSPLAQPALLLLQWVHGQATTAEAEREVPNFKKALTRAKRALNKSKESDSE